MIFNLKIIITNNKYYSMDTFYYINLEHRDDRKQFFENQAKQFNINSIRINAILNKRGDIGCGLSHIKALKHINDISNNSSFFIVCEDDFFIYNYANFTSFKNAFDIIKNDDSWDVIVMTPRGDTVSDISNNMTTNNFKKINNNQTATGYIIKPHMIPILIDTFKESVDGLIRNQDPNIYAIDQNWKKLQNKYNFYYYDKLFGGQLPGYSDIEKRNVNYNNRFFNQNDF
jgi:GR25 family glycosyltransferase involved in LPS biosynthesis